MRIRTLYLSSFGPFTNERLDFSTTPASLHLIYGNNEAGKSSARRALDALFGGIPRFTSDNFLHDNAQLRVGAHLCRTDAQELSFFRRKGNKTTFLDAQDNPLPDTILQEFLAGWEVSQFLQLHVINHEELVQGGKDLLEAKGDLGQSLFDAGMGGVRLLPVIEALDDEVWIICIGIIATLAVHFASDRVDVAGHASFRFLTLPLSKTPFRVPPLRITIVISTGFKLLGVQ